MLYSLHETNNDRDVRKSIADELKKISTMAVSDWASWAIQVTAQ
jgi:hypothetical protein